MSIRLVCANFLTINCVQELAENELAIVLATEGAYLCGGPSFEKRQIPRRR